MQLKRVLELENDVNRDYSKAIIIHQGDWYRSFEWSAYLLHHLIEEEEKRLKPVKSNSSLSSSGIVDVGFKKSSSKKYLNGFEIGDDEVTYVEIPNINVDEEKVSEILKSWKETIPFNSKKSKQEHGENSIYTKEDILDSILKYNTLNKTLKEIVNFFIDIQNKVSNVCS